MESFINKIINNLRESPNEWDFDGYELIHGSGIKVWAANRGFFYVVAAISPCIDNPSIPSDEMTFMLRFKLWRAIEFWMKWSRKFKLSGLNKTAKEAEDKMEAYSKFGTKQMKPN